MTVALNVRKAGVYSGDAVDFNNNYNADVIDRVDVAVPANAVNQQIAIAFTMAKLVAVELVAVGTDLTLKTNSTGSPANTFTLKAGKPFTWEFDVGITNPFTADVTTVYLSNPSATTAATLRGFVARTA
jgi:hypothetical protein